MHHRRCVCPQCGTTLRVKDRAYLGRPIPCPACRIPLILKAVGDDELEAVMADEPSEHIAPIPGATTRSSLRSPNARLVSWIATLLIAALIVAVVVWPRRSPKPISPAPVAESEGPVSKESAAKTNEPPQPAPKAANPFAARDTDGPDERLERLGTRLSDYHDRHGHWPTEKPATDPAQPGLSFLAALEPGGEETARRRVVAEFLNPNLAATMTAEGIGVTHFVGVAGVGEDGPELPLDHPRAGIFGAGRVTRRDDVTDGLSQTMLMLGVETRLGPWAAAGTATMRPLTQEPYVHGPDGFGTGQDDGMFVLMADGSVKFLNAATHPVLLRRMAAMADGLPLDLSVPGDPVPVMVEAEPIDATPLPEADMPPPEEPVAAAPPVDLDAALSQPLHRFRQTRGAARRELLELVEEMLGAPIRYDVEALGDAAVALDQRMTLDLNDVTVEVVLRRVLEGSGLIYEREKDGLRLQRFVESTKDE
jgi:hypothetical protein